MLPTIVRVIASLGLLAILAACAAVVSPGSAPAIASPAPASVPATATRPATATPAETGGPSVTPLGSSALPTPDARALPAVEAARQAILRQLNVPAGQVRLIGATRVEWPDSCLGVARADEMCAQMITPGYRIVFSTPQGNYELHTDAIGEQVRIAPPSGLVPVAPPAVPTTAGGQVRPAEDRVVQAARAALAAELKLTIAQVQLQSVEAVEWSDSCLGVRSAGEMCAQVITPGYRLIFTDPQGTHEVHTNRVGSSVRVAGFKR